MKWTTYYTAGYTHDVANDQASAGGVVHHQVRQARSGHWQRRTLQSNGLHSACGPVEPIDEATGRAHLATARQSA